MDFFPGVRRLWSYRWGDFAGDFTAGIIVTFLLLPQSMAYAMIAGVPLTMGLLAGTFPLFVYALFGSSKYLSVGPVSVVSLLAFTGVSGLANVDTRLFLEYIVLLALLVGIFQLIMGICKFGSLLKFVSPAIIGGFTSALAIIIIFNQMSAIIGVSLPKYQNFYTFTLEIFQNLGSASPLTVALGVLALISLYVIRKVYRVSYGPFIVLILSIIAVDFFDLDKKGVDIVGAIPRELPNISLHLPTVDVLFSLLPLALIIGFISFFESVSVAKTIAERERESINPNQELVGLGFANMTSSVIGAIPVAGAITRTAVNYESGAKTNLSLMITAVFMLIAVFYVTPLFYYLPKPVLAAIIIFAVINLINVKEFKYYVRHEPSEAFLFLATFLATLTTDVFTGLIAGIVLSLVMKLPGLSDVKRR